MKEEKNISTVIRDDLCTGCGACIALCPRRAIELTIDEKRGIYVPEIDEATCNNCGICLEICPGHEVDFIALNLDIFGKQPENPLVGNYKECYIGYANDEEIRYNCSSGGLITALLIYALKEGIIDGALVTRMKKDKPLEPEPFIAQTQEEIIEAARSKYCPVPANIAIETLLNSNVLNNIAVVGLPCHIQAIRKAEQRNKKLKNKIKFHFGLLCGGTHSFSATEILLYKLGINKENVQDISYRGAGYPGKITVKLNNGQKQVVPFIDYFEPRFGPRFFRPIRCNYCTDGTAELSDLSFGDAWTKECKKSEKLGQSICIARNEVGKKFLKQVKDNKIIHIRQLTDEEFKQSTDGMLKSKKKHVNICLRFAQLVQKRKVPRYNLHLIKPNILSIPIGILPYLNSYMGCSIICKKILQKLPLRLLKIYHLAIAGYFRYLL